MAYYLSIKEADAFLAERGLLRDDEPCVLIVHALIHALDGNAGEALRIAREIISKYGLAGTQCEAWVMFYVSSLAVSVLKQRNKLQGVESGQILTAFVEAQAIEAMTSIENRHGTAIELGLKSKDNLILVLNYPDALFEHFAKWKNQARPDVPSGSEWARMIYGQIFHSTGSRRAA